MCHACSSSVLNTSLLADFMSAPQLKERSEACSAQAAIRLQQAAALASRAADLSSRHLNVAAVRTPDIEEHARQRAAGVVNQPLKARRLQ
jgi:hypothetical protein